MAIILLLVLPTAWGQVPPYPTNPPGAPPPSVPSGRGPFLHWKYYAYGGLYHNGNTWALPGSGGAFASYFTISADARSITFDYAIFGPGPDKSWSASSLSLPPTIHNGIAIDALSDTVIESVAINPATNMAGFDASRVSFTGSQIQVDWVGLPFNAGTIVKLDVDFKGYPATGGRHAVGDFDRDSKDELALDFGPAGIWLYDQGAWTQLAPENPEALTGGRVDFGPYAILADLGASGLWKWQAGGWSQLSAMNVESMTEALAFGGGSDPGPALLADFGGLGLWQWGPGPNWRLQSGSDAESIIAVKIVGRYSTWHIADFGGLGVWRTGGLYGDYNPPELISREDPDQLIKAGLPSGAERLIGNFGPLGLWQYQKLLTSPYGAWSNLTNADADNVIAADVNTDGTDEIVGDFGALGLWLWDSTQWTQLADADAQYLIRADVTGDGSDEIAVDFGPDGIWVWNNGPWSKISGWDPQYLLAADTNGDGAQEILADFGAEGLWLWNGAWTRLSEDNPD